MKPPAAMDRSEKTAAAKSRIARWALWGFLASFLTDLCLALSGTFSANTEVVPIVQWFALTVNLPGIALMLVFGAVPMGEAEHTSLDTWNALLFCSGGVVFWTLVGAWAGFVTRDEAGSTSTGAAEPGSAGTPEANGDRSVEGPDQTTSG